MAAFIHIMVENNPLPGSLSGQAMGNDPLEDFTEVASAYFDMSRPFDVSTSAHPSGRVTVSPMTIVKSADAISPMLQEAFRANRRIDALLRFYTRSPEGEAIRGYELRLVNARLVGIRMELPAASGTFDAVMPLERVSIAPASVISKSWLGNQAEDELNLLSSTS